MIALQPAVVIRDEILLGALCILKEVVVVRPDLYDTFHNSPPHLYAFAAAAMWLVAKMMGVRTREWRCYHWSHSACTRGPTETSVLQGCWHSHEQYWASAPVRV
jgi:hypothetical protein